MARLAKIPEDRLKELEEDNAAPSVYELEALSRLYGLDAEILAETPIVVKGGDSIRVLALLEEFRDVSDVAKSEIVAAANAARDLVDLRDMVGERNGWQWFAADGVNLKEHKSGSVPYAEGSHYAGQVRRRLRLGDGPIASIRDAVSSSFPFISVLYARLKSRELAGIAFADRRRGAAIVLNLDGKNSNSCVRRFSLAHELCHLLVDFNRREPLAMLSGFLTEGEMAREQRANGFASRLLCPERVVRKIARDHTPIEAAGLLIERFGLHFDAVKLYLKNVANVDVPKEAAHIIAGIAEKWHDAEKPAVLKNFPLERAPETRRTLVAEHAAGLYSEGRLSRARFCELLGLTPVDEVEKVLDFFGLDVPTALDRS